MKIFLRSSLIGLLLAGCGSTDDDDDGSVVADGGTIVADSGPSCALTAPRAVAVRAGGIVEIEASEAGGSAITASWETGFVPLDGLRARAPYDGDPARSVTLTAACGDAATVSIAVQALVFEKLPTWDENTEGPDAREHPMLWIDPTNADRLFLFGGLSFDPQQFTVVNDLWSYDLVQNQWTSVMSTGAPLLAVGRLAVDPATGHALYEGGSDPNNALPFALTRIDTSGAEAAFTPITPTGAPNDGATLHGFVYDEPRGRYVSIAGFRDTLNNDVYAYDESLGTYTQLVAVGDAPSPRYGFFLAHDAVNERVIIFGGGQAGSRVDPVNPANDTYALELAEDPVRWVKLFDADESPPGRRNGCSAVDEAGHRFFVWGGTPDGRTTEPGLYALDLTRGAERWTRVDPEGPSAVRSSCAAVYDPARKRMLFGFGNNAFGIFADFNALPL